MSDSKGKYRGEVIRQTKDVGRKTKTQITGAQEMGEQGLEATVKS